MAGRDERWLQQRGQTWYCVMEVPRPLRKHFTSDTGKPKVRLIVSLHTSDLETARRRRAAALAGFEAQFEAARPAAGIEATIQSALKWRGTLARLVKGGGDPGFTTDKAPEPGQSTAQAALSVADWAVDDEADQIADQHGPEAAEAFVRIARSIATPLKPFIAAWLAESDIEARSRGDHQRAVDELLHWARVTKREATIEAFDRRTAGDYVSHLLGKGLDRGKTVTKRLWSLSSLWRFLIRKGHVETNVWLGHGVNAGGRSSRDKTPERPFTPAEVRALLTGPAEPVMRDLMHMAFCSGARLEELALLKVGDIDARDRTMAIHADPKSAASRRVVPISGAVWPIVAARIEGRGGDAFLLPELGPAPPEGRQRSMAISKAFRWYRESVGVDDKRDGQRRSLVNFHSFRRTFVTMAEQAGIPETTIRSVIGHKRAGMTFGLYSGGPSLEQRRACVESVRLPDSAPSIPENPRAAAGSA